MFERFTKDARAVVLGAVDHAERLHAETVEEQHVLLALLDREASRASFALMSLGLAERKESVDRRSPRRGVAAGSPAPTRTRFPGWASTSRRSSPGSKRSMARARCGTAGRVPPGGAGVGGPGSSVGIVPSLRGPRIF
jgi:ATP-dependent Clp protease ATP-binding subunit ClpA